MQIATRLATFQVRENVRKTVKIITKLYFLSLEDSIILFGQHSFELPAHKSAITSRIPLLTSPLA